MNYLQQFTAIFPSEHRAVARLVRATDNGYIGETTNGKNAVKLVGTGYEVGQTVFYDAYTGRMLEVAPDLVVVELAIR